MNLRNRSQNPKAIVKVKIYFHVLAAIIAQAASAQSTTTLIGARAAGLGYASAVTEDEWSLFNNVGGLARVNQLNASFAYEARPALIGANRMAASVSAPSKVGTLAVGIFRFGDDVYSEHLVSFGIGNQIGNTSLGAKVNYTQYRVESFGNTSAMSFDFGGITRITSQLSIGAYITNLTQSKLAGTDGERIPTKLVLGVGFKPSDKIFVATELEKDLDYQTMDGTATVADNDYLFAQGKWIIPAGQTASKDVTTGGPISLVIVGDTKVEADETFILKSAKGSKRLVGRAPRKRGGTAKKKGLSTDEHDCVLIVRDRGGATTDQVIPNLLARTFAAYLAPVVAKDAILVSDGRDAYGAFAHAENILHIPIITSRGEHAYKGFHIQNVNAYTSRLKDWLRPFKGVASWYLPSYLGWRRAIERSPFTLGRLRRPHSDW